MRRTAYIEEWKLAGTGARLSAIATLLLGLLLVISLNPYQDGIGIFLWFGVLSLVTCISYLHHFRNRTSRISSVYTQVLAIEAIKGLVWVIPALLYFPLYPEELQVFFVVIYVSMAFSYAIARHMIFIVSLASIGLALPVIVWRTVGLGEDIVTHELPLLALVGWVTAIILAGILKINFNSRVRLISENEQLVHRIDAKIQELEKLRAMEVFSRQEAEDANASKSRFLAYSSHDLRQPLHAIILLLETLKLDTLDPDNRTVVGKVKQSLESLTGLFDSLLDLAMLDTGKIDINRSVFCLGDLLEGIALEFDNVATANQIEMKYVPSTKLVYTDQVILRRMVQNLISNAIRYTDQGKIVLGVRNRGAMLSVDVCDNGRGIAEDQQDRIFDEFRRVDGEDGGPGLGLGLAIIKKMADVLELEVQLKSRSGAGSIFSISQIKTAHRIPQQPSVSVGRSGKSNVKPERIAIIDDDPEVLSATKAIVTKWGFAAKTYIDFDPCTFNIPDIVLCDFDLGGRKDGIEVVKEISKLAGKQVPAVLVTGDTSGAVEAKASEIGVPVLRKPVQPVQLRSVLLSEFSTRPSLSVESCVD